MSAPVFTCISCRVAFASMDLQRAHYKSDWHRYNLKRKVAELPPVTAVEFKQRLLAQQSKTAEEARDTSTRCGVCGKHFGTENAYTNHLGSKKHKEAEAKMKAASSADNGDEVSVKNEKNKRDQAKVDAYEGQKMMREGAEKKKELKIEDNAASSSSPSSSSSSSRKGNKPAVPAQVDDDEVMDDEEREAEWEDVEGEEIPPSDCLFCSRSSSSIEKNLHHMTVSHSFFLPNVEFIVDMEELLTYLGVKVGCDFMCLWCNNKGKAFYSLDSVQRHMRDKGHSKMLYEGDAIYEYSDFYDFRKSYPDFDAKNGGAVGGEVKDGEEEDEEEEMDLGSCEMKEEGFELTLPSGIKIGHRELSKYYKQNLPLERRVAKKNPALIGRLMTQYKALGWHGLKGEASEKMIRDLRYVQKFRSKKHLSLGVRANKFQTYFRCQNPI